MVEMIEESKHKKRKHRHFFSFLVVLIFLSLVGGLFYYSYSGEVPFTGSAVSEVSPENAVEVSARLSAPESLSNSGEIGEVRMNVLNSEAVLYVGPQKTELSGLGKIKIVLIDFEGDLKIEGSSISLLNGRASEVLINGIPSISESGKKVKVRLDNPVFYDSLELKDSYFASIDYSAYGDVKVQNKASLTLDGDRIQMGSFKGDLEVRDNRFFFDGLVKKINVAGLINIQVQ